jgi:TonB-dependent receptor
MEKRPILARLALFTVLAATLAFGPAAAAADGPTGSVEGRVLNATGGEYLERARVVVEGTSLETFTDAGGNYRFPAVPAGTVRVSAHYSGFPTATATVAIAAGQIAARDFSLALTPRAAAGEVVEMSKFVISSAREMQGAAIAINEQRHAPNLRTVVATDELGFVPEGNVAEFVKFLPGVSVDNVGGFSRNISINGAPSDYIPVTIDGFSVASANPGGGTARSVSLDMLSINNLARVEVVFSPTPESQGSALAGSVNMVPRSAFERARPVLNWNAYLLMRDNARDFHRTPGPQRAETRKVHPGFDFTYVRPVSRNFGFTVAAGTSTNYLNQDFITNTWRGAGAATNGTTFPHTTPDRPYLSSFLVRDNTKDSTRNSFGVTLDARLGPADRVALAFQFSSTAFANMSRTLTFNVGAVDPGAFTPFATRGRTGAGSLVLANTGQTRDNRTIMPTLVWRHLGPLWRAEAGFGYSRATHTLRNIDRGLFNTTNAQRTGVTVSFDDIFYLRPRVITVADGATGAPLNPYRLENYALLTASSSGQHTTDAQRTLYANAGRDFAWRVPVTLKGGLDFRLASRDLAAGSSALTYVGRDGRASTTLAGGDDAALPFLDAGASQRFAPFGFPQVQWVSNEGVLEHYRANPTQFTDSPNNTYRAWVNGSKFVSELVSSAYLRGDVALLDRRLKLIGGARVEQTNLKAEGPLNDPTRNYQRDASGRVVTVASPTPAEPNRRTPALIVPNTAANALAISQLTLLERASRTRKEYLRFFPSLNASYHLRENLVARAAVYESIGRPNYNQYAGGVTLPDTESPANPLTNRIVVNNAGIKPWSARTANVRLEYYFEGVGQVSVGAFRRDYENFFDNVNLPATPQLLELYGIDPAIYGDYSVATQANLADTLRTTGVDVSYKQSLTFLPRWARGIQVFANASAQRATGGGAENFAGYVPRSYNWGLSLTREKFNLRANWSYRGRQRLGLVAAGASIEPGTYNWGSKKLTLDLQGEYSLVRAVALFVYLRNVNNGTEDFEIAGLSTPPHAQFRSRQDLGSLWTVGLKGTF